MRHGGRAWRGYFPSEKELTSGRPDQKEGLYFGSELPPSHPRAGFPLHGQNLFPKEPPRCAALVLDMAALTQLGHRLMVGMSLSLGLPADYFQAHYTADPTRLLFRVFHYRRRTRPRLWGVGEHTDYGL